MKALLLYFALLSTYICLPITFAQEVAPEISHVVADQESYDILQAEIEQSPDLPKYSEFLLRFTSGLGQHYGLASTYVRRDPKGRIRYYVQIHGEMYYATVAKKVAVARLSSGIGLNRWFTSGLSLEFFPGFDLPFLGPEVAIQTRMGKNKNWGAFVQTAIHAPLQNFAVWGNIPLPSVRLGIQVDLARDPNKQEALQAYK